MGMTVLPWPICGSCIRTIMIPLGRFCYRNQQDRELARGWWVDKLGRILIDFLLCSENVGGVGSSLGLYLGIKAWP